jgi:8-oxo-dGTP diphosphatase
MKITEVAVGVLSRDDGTVLLATRPASKVYAGYWEFPGGKIEAGETPRQALDRELNEELGIRVLSAHPWIVQEFTYPHARVRLNFFRVRAWEGAIRLVEHEAFSWQRPDAVDVEPLLPANGPVLRGLSLPNEYALTQCRDMGIGAQLDAIERRLREGLRLIQVREPGMDPQALRKFLVEVLDRARSVGARVLVNANADLASEVGADGIHLSSRQLSTCESRPAFSWVAASCHNKEELNRAQMLGIDFVVLGSVAPTPSHPEIKPLGWEIFSRIIQGTTLPVFALGGVGRNDLERAWTCGAHGIAMQRGAWRD